MFKRVLFTASILAILLTACGGQQQNLPPTMSPMDIQNTAAAAAFTMIAATQMAMPPTATFVPPPVDTPLPPPTPLPTFTPEMALPTLEQPQLPIIQPSPTSSFSSNLGECNRILSVADAGPTYSVRIQNMSGGVVTLSLYLSKNEFGQCGYMPGLPQTAGSYTVQLPIGYWYFFALIDYGKGKSGQSYGYFTVNSSGADVVKIIAK